MPTLYVKIDEKGYVIEACLNEIEGGIAVIATDQQVDEILNQRKDAIVSNGSIESTSIGLDYQKRLDVLNYRDSLIPVEG